MSWSVALMLHAAAPSAAATVDSFDLRSSAATERCKGDGDSIVVCARQERQNYRLRGARIDALEPQPLRATIGIVGDLSASLHGDQSAMPDGTTNSRVMFTLKMPF